MAQRKRAHWKSDERVDMSAYKISRPVPSSASSTVGLPAQLIHTVGRTTHPHASMTSASQHQPMHQSRHCATHKRKTMHAVIAQLDSEIELAKSDIDGDTVEAEGKISAQKKLMAIYDQRITSMPLKLVADELDVLLAELVKTAQKRPVATSPMPAAATPGHGTSLWGMLREEVVREQPGPRIREVAESAMAKHRQDVAPTTPFVAATAPRPLAQSARPGTTFAAVARSVAAAAPSSVVRSDTVADVASITAPSVADPFVTAAPSPVAQSDTVADVARAATDGTAAEPDGFFDTFGSPPAQEAPASGVARLRGTVHDLIDARRDVGQRVFNVAARVMTANDQEKDLIQIEPEFF